MVNVVVRFADGNSGYLRDATPNDQVDIIVADIIAGRDAQVVFADVITGKPDHHRTGDIVEITIRLP